MQVGTRNKYWGPTKWLGGFALAAFAIGLVFTPLSRALLSEATRSEIIVQALPFVLIFIGILLLFILGVALVGARWHLLVPARTHSVVEYTIIAGILAGILFMFQPWNIAPYHYGFGMLLGSTLAFIVWSHIAPRSPRDDAKLPPFSRRATLIGVIVAVVVSGTIFGTYALGARPEEPYGMRQRRWDTLSEDRQAEVAREASSTYLRVYLPFLLLYSAIPGLALFFIVREAATPKPLLPPSAPEAEDSPPHTVSELEGA